MNPETLNVYLVSHGEPGDLCIDRLFSSLELALAWLKEHHPAAEWGELTDVSYSSKGKDFERLEIVGRFPGGLFQRFEVMVHEVDA